MSSLAGNERASARPDPREAARAAAEARLRSLAPAEPAVQAPTPTHPTTTTTTRPADAGPAKPAWLAQTSSPSSSSGSGLFARSPVARDAKWEPTEKEDRELRRTFGRLLDRGIVRDNGYKEAAACIETLHTIASNVIKSDDPKFRNLKMSNSALKNKVLAVIGGREYLIALGFRARTIDFTEHLVFEPSLKKSHELKVGTEMLQQQLAGVQARAASAADRQKLAAQENAARVARTLAEIDSDRDSVRVRVERDKRMREREERIAREKADREARAEQEREALLEEERARQAEQVPPPPPYIAGSTNDSPVGDHSEEEPMDQESDAEDGSDDEEYSRGYH